MKQAILNVESRAMGWKLAARTFSVPKSTLRRRVLEKNKILKGADKGFLGGAAPVFDTNIENKLVEHIKLLSDQFFGLTSMDVRKLAFQLAEKLNLKHSFNKEKGIAGWDWFRNFMNRNPTLSIRTPEATSLARAEAFNKNQIKKYFDCLKKVITEHDLKPDQIFNMDESGFSTVQSKTEKVLAQRGRKQVGTLTSAERGHHFTVVCCMNAIGNYIPPGMIFPRKNMKRELIDKAPTGTIGLAQENGWMNGEVCLKWMQHFKKYSKPSDDHKILLLLDGHSSHKNLDVLQFAKENNIILFCFPPHCTHRVQPLDVSFFGPLTTYFNQAVRRWLVTHPGRTVTHFQVGELLDEAYVKAATVGNAVSGFKNTGIVPFNDDIFPEWMFTPSNTTDLTPSNAENIPPGEDKLEETTEMAENDRNAPEDNYEKSQPSTSSGSPKKLLQELSPIPTANLVKKRRTAKRGQTGVLNSTPNIEEKKEVEKKKKAEEERKAAKRAKKNLKFLENESDEDGDDDDVGCIYCNGLYKESRRGDKWIQCQKCRSWCHIDCAGIEKKQKCFICDLCK